MTKTEKKKERTKVYLVSAFDKKFSETVCPVSETAVSMNSFAIFYG